MAQAGKLFDKKNGTAAQGANQDAKAEGQRLTILFMHKLTLIPS